MKKKIPQLEDGYTRLANEILEALAGIHIPPTARRCLDVILRKTYGFHKKEDKISLSQFALVLKIEKRNIIRAIQTLAKMNIIILKKEKGTIKSYRFNKDYTSWILFSKLRTVSILRTSILNIENKTLPLLTPTIDIDTKDTFTKDILWAAPPEETSTMKISRRIVDKFLAVTGYRRLDGRSFELDNLFPAKSLAKTISEDIKLEGGEVTDDGILIAFEDILLRMDDWHKKNATTIAYIKNNYQKITNTMKPL